MCEGEEHLLTELAAMEQLDGEGMMLRHPTAAHRGGRNVDLLKVKSFHDAEAIVTDYEEGKGKYAGMVGSLVCRSRQGAAFKVRRCSEFWGVLLPCQQGVVIACHA